MPAKKPRAKATARTRRIPPKNQALRGMLPGELGIERMNNRQKMVFENLVRQKTGGRALPEREMRRVAQRCAERALNLDLLEKSSERQRIKRMKVFESITSVFNPYNKKIAKALSMLPEKADLLFESGAEMTTGLTIGSPLIDWPFTTPGLRLVVKPQKSEYGIKGVSDKLEKLSKKKWSDADDYLGGSIGYFGLSFGLSKKKGFFKRKRLIGIIAVRQERFLPEFPHKMRKRYENWDLELLRFAEAKLRQCGVQRMAVMVPEEHKKGVLVQAEKFRVRAERAGCKETPIEFAEILLKRSFIDSPKGKILVKELME